MKTLGYLKLKRMKEIVLHQPETDDSEKNKNDYVDII